MDLPIPNLVKPLIVLLVIVAVSVPLAVWKLVEIVVSLVHHVHLHIS